MRRDVKGVGQRDTVQDVSDGYALNFLIAQGLAEQATPHKLAALESRKKMESAVSEEKNREWAELAGRIQNAVIDVHARANAAGHLYEQLSPESIASALRAQLQREIPTGSIVLSAPIKSVGENTVGVRLGASTAQFKINVRAAQ